MTNKTKAAIEEAANEHKNRFNSLVRVLIQEDDRAYESFLKGVEHAVEHPERYGLITREEYEKDLQDAYNQGATEAVHYVNENILK